MKQHLIVLISAVLFINCACGSKIWKKPTATQEAAEVQTIILEEPAQTPREVPPAEEEAAPVKTAASPKEESKQAALPPATQAKQSAPQTPQIKQEAPPAEAKTDEKAAKDTPANKEAEQKEPEDKNIFKGEDGRLIHPWYDAQEIKNYAGKKPVWFGESLKFKIGWSFVTAGEADLIAKKIVTAGGQNAFAFEAYAQSYSVIDAFFKVRDMNSSWVSVDFKKSLGYWQSVREGKYARDEWVIFDYKNNSYTTYKQDRRGNISKTPRTFEGSEVFDMLSSLYFVRTQQLPLKGEIFFDIVNRNEQYPLKVIVHGKETVKVKAGKFNCIVVEPAFSGEGIFVAKGKSLKVWLTDDEYKMPVKMSVEVFIGSVKAELVSYSRSDKE